MAQHPVEYFLQLTQPVDQFLRKFNNSTSFKLSESDQLILKESLEEKKISYLNFKHFFEIYNNVQKDSNKKVYMHEVLAGSSVFIPTPKPVVKEKSPEVELEFQKARVRAADRVYWHLVKGILPKERYQKAEDTKAMREGMKAAVLPLNVLFSVLGVFSFFFYISRYCEVPVAKAFIIGLIAAFSILAVEVVLVILKLRKTALNEAKWEAEEDKKYDVFRTGEAKTAVTPLSSKSIPSTAPVTIGGQAAPSSSSSSSKAPPPGGGGGQTTISQKKEAVEDNKKDVKNMKKDKRPKGKKKED